MSTLHIDVAKAEYEMPATRYDQLLSRLPFPMATRNVSYHRWEDRHLHLFGKLLLTDAMSRFGLGQHILGRIRYNGFGRPLLDEEGIDFNISHSGSYVVCAAAKGIRLGIDIEEIKPIDFSDFQNTMSTPQWRHILAADSPLETFYKYWTIKESVIKADSRGLSIPLTEIVITGNRAYYGRQQWYTREFQFDEKYAACIACSQPVSTLSLVPRDYYPEPAVVPVN